MFLPDKLVVKLRRFRAFKKQRRESLEPDAPLFCNQSRTRISKRRVQFAWREWQKRAGFDRLYPFHCIAAQLDNQRLPGDAGSVPGAEVVQLEMSLQPL